MRRVIRYRFKQMRYSLKINRWLWIHTFCWGFASTITMLVSPIEARQISTTLEHFPVTVGKSGKPIEIHVRITSSVRPVYVRVYFKTFSEQNFRFADLIPEGNGYRGAIPGESVRTPITQYFILALYSNRSIETLPALNPYGQPFEIIVEEQEKENIGGSTPSSSLPPSPGGEIVPPPGASSDAAVFVLSPEPLREIAEDEVVIAAGFAAGRTTVDPKSVKVVINGRDYTHAAAISEFVVTLSPKKVAAGTHQVVITAKDSEGKTIPPLSWRFIVSKNPGAKEETGSKSYRGRVFAEIRQESFSNKKLNANSFGGNLDGQFGAFNVQAVAYVTALEDSRLQPRNRFSLNIRSRLIEFGVGDQYPYYNEVILWGRRVRGLQAALNLGFINFQYISGETVRKVDPVRDTNGTLISFGTYPQNLSAARLSFGRGNTFQFGLMGLKVRDDRHSLKSGESSVTPKDNLVVGTDFLLRLFRRRFELKASVASSILTQDISNGPATKETIDSTFNTDIPFDPAELENLLIINESTTPLDPSSGTSMAYFVSLRLNILRNNLQIGLKKFGREYVSLAQTYLRNNLRGFFINDRINLFRNRVFVNLGVESYEDNFSQDDGNPRVDLTTFNYGMTVFFGQNLPSVSFGLRNYVRDNGIEELLIQQTGLGGSDTTDTREQSITRDFNANLSYSFSTGSVRHSANLSVIQSKLIDEFSASRLTPEASRDFSNLVQSITLKSEFAMPLVTTISFATNKSQSTLRLNEVDFTAFSGRAEYSLLSNRALTLYTGLRSIRASGARNSTTQSQPLAIVDYGQLSFQFGLYFVYRQRHRFVMDVDVIRLRDNGKVWQTATGTYLPNPSFNNSILRLFYEFRL